MNDKTPRVVLAPSEKITKIKETLDKQGNVIKREVIKPKS